MAEKITEAELNAREYMRNTEARTRYTIMKELHANVGRDLNIVEFVALDENPKLARLCVREILQDYEKNKHIYENKRKNKTEDQSDSVLEMVFD